MARNPLDLFLHWQQVSIPAVVDALKVVHERRRDDAAPIVTAPSARGAVARSGRTVDLPDLSSWLGALVLLENGARGIAPEPATYDRVRRHFLDLQTQLRRQKLAIEGLLGTALPSPDSTRAAPPLFQQTLHLQCARTGRSAGRFRCVNRVANAARVVVTATPLSGDVAGRLEGATLSVSPPECVLGAGEHRTLTVTVDFSKCAPSADTQAGAMLDVTMDGELALKLWIAVELHDAGS